MEFRVLGSLEVVKDDHQVALGSPKQRALLAALLVHRRQMVSADRLIDELWGDHPPATARKIVQGYVSSLRKVLGDGLLVSRGHGYLLQADPDQTDVDRFESLAAKGHRGLADGDPSGAAALLAEALGLWRGPPLAEFAYESFAQSEIARLEESRLAALEDRIEAELALGEHVRLVGELEALVHEHPLRERLIGQLMLALYRSGRQAEALETYRKARSRLVEELGLEPGRELRDLERAILAQDSSLAAPKRAAPAAARRARRRGGLLIAAGGAVLLAAIASVALALSGGTSQVQVAPNSVAAIDTRSNSVVGAVPVGTTPGAIAFGSGSLWVANQDDQSVSRVDPRTLRVLQAIPVGNPPTGIAAGAGQIWVGASDLNPDSTTVSVSRIDPQFNDLVPVVRPSNVIQGGPEAVATQGDQVWAAPSAGLLTRLDGRTGQVVGRLDPNANPTGIAIGDGAVWVTDNQADNVTRVDPTGLPTPIAVGNGPSGIAVGEGGVWVADSLDNAVVRIDPTTRAVLTTIPVGQSPEGVAIGAGSVWVANSGDGTVSRIDPSADKVIARIPVGGSPQALTVADGRVWVTDDAQSLSSAGAPAGAATLRIDSPAGLDSMDPALATILQSTQLLQATCVKLLNFPDKPGPAGWQPTPEAAQSLPARSADGTTYTFKIRKGFRFFPSGEPITAQTFKHSLERAFSPTFKNGWAVDFTDIAGMSAYEAGKSVHISGLVVRGDTLAIHLVAPRPDLLARLTEQATCAVPLDTPTIPAGVRVIPSAGPYYVRSYTPGQEVVLVRNPYYHGSRPRHFQRIEVAMGMSTGKAVAAVKAGTADYTTLALGPSPGAGLTGTVAAEAAALAARYGPGSPAAARGTQEYFVDPSLQLDYFVLNTQRPLFSDLRLRQAVNYAIDRRKLASLGDGFQPLPEHPTDHYLPPGMPGYRNAHVYPLTPDPARARQLANGHGRVAVLYTCNVSPCPEQAQIISSDLVAVGLRVQIKTLPTTKLNSILATPGEPFDLAWGGWIADFPDPYEMLNVLLENSSIIAPTFNDPTYQRELAAAARRSGPEHYLAYGKLDLDIARNAAPLLAFGNLSIHDFFAARIGCQTYLPFFGMDLAALCLRHTGRS